MILTGPQIVLDLLKSTYDRRPSHQHIDNLIMEDQRRRLSEAGVNR